MSIDLAQPSSPTRDTMTEKTPIRKFTFNHSFDTGKSESLAAKKPPKPIYTQEQFDAAYQAAFQEGIAAGQEAAQQSQEIQTQALVQALARKVTQAASQLIATMQSQHTLMVEAVTAIARKIMPRYVEQHGLDEIQVLVESVLRDLSHEPRLVVRVAEAQVDVVDGIVKTLAEQKAFEGQMIVMASPDFGPSDCLIEWADGGIERNVAALWDEIERALARHKDAENPTDSVVTPPDTVS